MHQTILKNSEVLTIGDEILKTCTILHGVILNVNMETGFKKMSVFSSTSSLLKNVMCQDVDYSRT